MMVFAGAFSVQPNALIPERLKTELKLALTRRPHPNRVHDGGRFFLNGAALRDMPTFETDAAGSLSALSGDPLILQNGKPQSLHEQLRLLHAAAQARQTGLFQQARGTYCFIHYNALDQRLWLAADLIGLRPIYYTVQNGILIFASALRILEATRGINKRLSLQGMAELCALGYPLGNHTPYENIFVLRESELLEITEAGEKHLPYDHWLESDAVSLDQKGNAARLSDIFKESVALRADGNSNAYAYLSGGLDSRAIVAALLERGMSVTALNFSPDGSQDQAFAKGFAQAAGPSLQLHCFGRYPNPNFSLLAADAISKLHPGEQATSAIWSGDGGSVGLGHVYITEAMLSRLESGDFDGTSNLFLKTNQSELPLRIFAEPVRKRLEGYLVKTISAELKRYVRKDPGRSLYLFLLFNDQRRHLFKHFETMDEHGFEFQLPFYDAVFLKAVAATPIRQGILHRLYMDWFDHFPAFARSTPWQTYPGHVPCPLSSGDGLSYQWSQPKKAPLSARLKTARALLSSLAAKDLPPGIFSRAQLALAATTHLTGARDFEYVLEFVQEFRLHRRRCNTPESGLS